MPPPLYTETLALAGPVGMGRALCVDPEAASKKGIMKIEINLKNVSREEIEELKKYLEENCWDWKVEPQAASFKRQASSLTNKIKGL